MKLDSSIGVSDLVAIFSLIFAIIGGLLSYLQWRKNILIKRAAYINELTEKVRTDKDIQRIFYRHLEYGKKWYSKRFHESGALEKKLIKH